MVMKRIVILVVLVFVIATSLALSAHIASAQQGPRCDDPGEKPVFVAGRKGPPTFLMCEPAGGGGGPVGPR